MTKKFLWGLSSFIVVSPLAVVFSCSNQNSSTEQVLVKQLRQINKRQNNVLKNFLFADQAVEYLNTSNGNVLAFNGKKFIFDNAAELFAQTMPIEIDKISEFQAQKSQEDSTVVEVSFQMETNLSPNLKATAQTKIENYGFKIVGFASQENPLDVQVLANKINEDFKNGKYNLINPNQGADSVLIDDETFAKLPKDAEQLIPYINGFKKEANVNYKVVDFTNENRILQFKLTLSKDKESATTNFLVFKSYSKIFDDFILTTSLIAPTQNVEIKNQNQAINLGNSTINEQNQKAAINKYLEKQWSFSSAGGSKQIQTDKTNSNIFIFSLNQKTNTLFNRVFGRNWDDLFFNSSNSDFKQVSQIIVGFELKSKTPSLANGGIAVFEYLPRFIQFSWSANKPGWLTKSTSHRTDITQVQSNQLIQLSVKNSTSGNAGELIAKP